MLGLLKKKAASPDVALAGLARYWVDVEVQIDRDNNIVYALEDYFDPDGRGYRIEYQCTLDGGKAISFCRFNPWDSSADHSKPRCGTKATVSHIHDSGLICVGAGITSNLKNSARYDHDHPEVKFDLEYAINTSRFWAVDFSAFMETGDPEVFNLF